MSNSSIAHLATVHYANNSFTLSVPQQSVTLFVLHPASAARLGLAAAANAAAGQALDFTVTALDAGNNPLDGYTGTVHFTSTDAAALLPANYTFQPGDHGQHTFTITLRTTGSINVTVTDANNGDITNPAIRPWPSRLASSKTASSPSAVRPATTALHSHCRAIPCRYPSTARRIGTFQPTAGVVIYNDGGTDSPTLNGTAGNDTFTINSASSPPDAAAGAASARSPTIGHPVLRQKARPLTREELARAGHQELIDDMIETMRAAHGAGLAAPQVDEPLRIAVVEVDEGNPRYPYKPPIPLTVDRQPGADPLDDGDLRHQRGLPVGARPARGVTATQRPRRYLDRDGSRARRDRGAA